MSQKSQPASFFLPRVARSAPLLSVCSPTTPAQLTRFASQPRPMSHLLIQCHPTHSISTYVAVQRQLPSHWHLLLRPVARHPRPKLQRFPIHRITPYLNKFDPNLLTDTDFGWRTYLTRDRTASPINSGATLGFWNPSRKS
jgi:hypothetical protein